MQAAPGRLALHQGKGAAICCQPWHNPVPGPWSPVPGPEQRPHRVAQLQSMPHIHIADLASLTRMLSEELMKTAAAAIAERGLFSIALPGGSVATSCFSALAVLPID